MGGVYATALWIGLSKNPRETLKLAIELHRKAIELDDSLAIAHAYLGYHLITARQYDKGIAAGERAVALEPSSADVIQAHAAILTFVGRREEAPSPGSGRQPVGPLFGSYPGCGHGDTLCR